MTTYYGINDDGSMAHIRMKESMEQWHVRCMEQSRRITALRQDVGTQYSRKNHFLRIAALEAAVEKLEAADTDARVAVNMLTAAVATLAALVGVDTTIAPVIDGEVRLPCPEHGGECQNWPVCTD